VLEKQIVQTEISPENLNALRASNWTSQFESLMYGTEKAELPPGEEFSAEEAVAAIRKNPLFGQEVFSCRLQQMREFRNVESR
jgi:hypothetical protein